MNSLKKIERNVPMTMSDKDIEEYHNIGKAIKLNGKYNYLEGKQITDPDTGKRVYEITLHYPGLYAGQTDLVCLHNDLETIVDFKQANRPKKKEWIEDYYLQIAAYAMAHDYVYKSQIRQGVIMVCTPDLYYQEFRITDHELRTWKHKFLKRLDMYYELVHDEKEKAKVNLNPEDFTK